MTPSHAYPVMLDVSDRFCVIIGGGAVAARKARGLIAAGARHVRVIAVEFRQPMPQGVQCLTRAYQPTDVTGAALVFAATDSSQVNEAVTRDARAAGALVNRADVDEEVPSDFSTPAMFQNGSVTVTIAAGGSPALAAMIRDQLSDRFDPRWAAMADAMQVLRPMLRTAVGLSPERRREAFRDLATPAACGALCGGGMHALRAWLLERYPEMKDAQHP